MRERWLGLLLFLPVPVVLVLFTQAPLGVAASLVLGVALMATHRLYARPFALARAERRCLWCGRDAAEGPLITVEEPDDTTRWRTCTSGHEERARRFLGRAGAHALALKAGILLPLVVLLGTAVWVALRPRGWVRYADAVNAFRLAIAGTVLPLALPFGRDERAPADPLSAPFPVHIQSLIGTASVIWLFRVVGLLWLALGLVHFARLLK